MKKWFLVGLLVLASSPLFAASDLSTNTWASWANVTTGTVMTFPVQSRQITIVNGDATAADAICVSLNGTTPTNGCISTGTNGYFMIPGGQAVSLYNVVKNDVRFNIIASAASPVTVIVGY
jgi:hypothetical protein